MTQKSDAVTRWWRGISLRAKVTGVTVALLAMGLFVAGFGTMAFLRTTLITNLEEQLRQLAPTDLTTSLVTIYNDAGVLSFTPNEAAGPTDYFVGVYDQAGVLKVTTGGSGGPPPVFPDTITLQQTAERGIQPFPLASSSGGAPFRASTDVLQIDGVSDLYTQLVALPLAPSERIVATYIGIYGILALLIVIAGALLTRWLVTLTFRGLGQVESTAMSIAAGDFSQRMADVVPGTEVGRLKAAINTMLWRIDAAIRQREATVRQMRRFIGDASHELRTPLVTVRGYAELYRMGAVRTDEDVAQAMERIEKEAIRMGVLVEDLLALARLDEKRDVEITPVDLRPLARDAALDLRAASQQREVSVEDTTLAETDAFATAVDDSGEETPPDAGRKRAAPATAAIALAGATLSRLRRRPATAGDAGHIEHLESTAPIELVAPIVLGDENRIRQVIANLLGNARRFTAADSPIGLRVGVDAPAGMGWIEVIDHGEGIPEQVREQIFERFWRADTSRTRDTGGSGLGLSIVASIVESLHGSVGVTDTPGGGATFRVSLPLSIEKDAADAAPADDAV